MGVIRYAKHSTRHWLEQRLFGRTSILSFSGSTVCSVESLLRTFVGGIHAFSDRFSRSACRGRRSMDGRPTGPFFWRCRLSL